MRSDSPRWLVLVLVLVAMVVLTSRQAGAQTSEQGRAAELVALEEDLESELASLATDDCAVACRALEAIVRLAQRICALDPGPRCDEARKKVANAKRRVGTSCPDCAAAKEKQPQAPPEEAEQAAPAPASAEPTPTSAPPAADKKGGCAACTFVAHEDDAAGVWYLVALVLAALRRSRRGRHVA